MADVNTIMGWTMGSYNLFIGTDGDLHSDLYDKKFRTPVWTIFRELEAGYMESLE